MNAAGIFFQILAVEDVGLGAERGGDPLPGEVVGGGVANEQMAQEPAGSGLPADAAEVGDVGGEPQTGEVVQETGGGELAGLGVDAGESSGAVGDVVRECVAIFGYAGFVGLAVGPNRVADLGIDALPVVAPCEFPHKFRGVGAGAGGTGPRERQDTIEDVGAETGDGGIEKVVGGRVGAGTEGGEWIRQPPCRRGLG